MPDWRALSRMPQQAWNYARLPAVSWLEDQRLAACKYPRSEADLRALADSGVKVLVNLHVQAHPPELLTNCGLEEVHLPVADFTAPTEEQLRRGVNVIDEAIRGGTKVAVHCGGGLGRTGTLVACYLVTQGRSAEDAIAEVRRLRPGSVETPAQEAAVRAFAASRPR
jgi:atypical dual specificity phosphatase